MFVCIPEHQARRVSYHDLGVAVDYLTNCSAKELLFLAMLDPLPPSFLRVRVHSDDAAVRRSEHHDFAVVGGSELRGEGGTREVRVLKVVVHVRNNVHDSLCFMVVLPDSEASPVANRDEVYVDLTIARRIDNDFGDAQFAEDYCAIFDNSSLLDINNGQVAFFSDGGCNEELAAVAECHRLNSVAEEADFVDQLVLHQVVQIDERAAMAARLSLRRSQDPFSRVTSQRRKSHLRVYQDSLWVTSPRAFNNDLVVQSVGDHARGWRPEQIVMHTTEAIVAIHCEGLNDLALSFFHDLWPLFDFDVHVERLADADELIERKLARINLLVVVLGDTRGI